MNNVIKRRKTSNYAQIHNNPLQGGLQDLRAVGLLAHIMSLPEDWTLHKTQLQNTYSRKNVDAGWKELAQKNYVIGFSCYVNGHKNYFYNVSDIPFTQNEFEEFAVEQINELKKDGKSIKNASVINHSSLDITDIVTDVLSGHHSISEDVSTDVLSVQYKENCTKSAYTKEIDNKEIKTNKHLNNIGNKETFVSNPNDNDIENFSQDETIHKLTNEYRLKGMSKELCLRVVREALEKKDINNFGGYLRSCLESALHKSQVKRGLKDPAEKLRHIAEQNNAPFYNWLDN